MSSVSTRPSRMLSQTLASFPWYSGIIRDVDDFSTVLDQDDYQNFVRSLLQYESLLFNQFTGRAGVSKLQQSLGILFNSLATGALPPVPVSNKAADYSRLCSVVCAYRLVDILGMSANRHPALIVERGSLEVTAAKFRGIDKVCNWTEVLLHFKQTLSKAKKPVPLPPLPQDRSTAYRLLRLIARNRNTRNYASIEANFLFAAMHIACMKDLRFAQDVCPDLPDDISGFVQNNTLSSDQEDLEDVKALLAGISSTYNSGEGVSCMRAPLHLALLISPIYLLLPIQLFKKSYNRQTMLSISQSLGNQKPRILQEVEMAIWRAVFALAGGLLDPLDILQSLSDSLPWTEIQAASSTDSDRKWFSHALQVLPPASGPAIEGPDASSSSQSSKVTAQLPSRAADIISSSLLGDNDGNAIQAPESGVSSAFPTQPTQSAVPPEDPGAPMSMDHPESPPVTRPDEETQKSSTAAPRDSPVSDNNMCGHDDAMQVDSWGGASPGPDPSRLTSPPPIDNDNRHPNHRNSLDDDFQDSNSGVHNVGDDVGANATPSGDNQGDSGDNENDSGENENEHDSGENKNEHDSAENENEHDSAENDNDSAENEKEHDSGAKENDSDHNDDSMQVDPDPLLTSRFFVDADAPPPPSNCPPPPSNCPPPPSNRPPPPSNRLRRPAAKRPRIESPEPEMESSDSESDSPEVIDVDLYVSLWEPSIKIKDEEPTDLEIKDDIQRIKCDTELRAFDARGVEHRFTPEFHFPEHAARVKEFFAHIETSYRDGQPLHIADPDTSAFDIISYAEFRAMSPPDVQARLCLKNIIVTDCPRPSINFDEAGLRTLSALDSPASIQDYSVSNTGPVTLTGQAKDLLSSKGKILNGLDFPMWKDSEWNRCSYATDMVAWDRLRGRHHCQLKTPYPTEHMRWGLAGTANTFTSLHVDSDGFATFVQVMSGMKVWVVYRPSSLLPLSSTNVFTDSDTFQLDKIPKNARFGLEAMVLKPGDQLLLQPGVPHFVYGVEHTIIHGGHFYCASQMQAIVQSLVHTFILNHFISNTFHTPSRELLRRIVIFWATGLLLSPFSLWEDEYLHLPDVRTLKGLLDLISGCALAVLGNVLDFRTYSAPNQLENQKTTRAQSKLWKDFDRNDIPGDERMAICYARGIVLTVFDWIRDWCIIKTPDGEVVEDLPSKYMVNLLDALIGYKENAMAQDLHGAPHCSLQMLQDQISNVVKCDKFVATLWGKRTGGCSTSLRIDIDEGCTVEWKDNAPSSLQQPPKVYLEKGKTPFDHKFIKGEHCRSQIEVKAVKSHVL